MHLSQHWCDNIDVMRVKLNDSETKRALVKSEGDKDPTWSCSRGTVSLALHQVVWLTDWFYSSTSLLLSFFYPPSETEYSIFCFELFCSEPVTVHVLPPQRVKRNWSRKLRVQSLCLAISRTELHGQQWTHQTGLTLMAGRRPLTDWPSTAGRSDHFISELFLSFPFPFHFMQCEFNYWRRLLVLLTFAVARVREIMNIPDTKFCINLSRHGLCPPN
jgi:hypothetical protein